MQTHARLKPVQPANISTQHPDTNANHKHNHHHLAWYSVSLGLDLALPKKTATRTRNTNADHLVTNRHPQNGTNASASCILEVPVSSYTFAYYTYPTNIGKS